MIRARDWDTSLAEWARHLVGLPFRWGETDCSTLVRGAVTAMYGADPWEDVPRPQSAAEARSLQQRHGSVPEILLRAGAERVPPGYAQSGDVWWVARAHAGLGGGGVVIAAAWLLGFAGREDEESCVALAPLASLDEGAELYRLPWEIAP